MLPSAPSPAIIVSVLKHLASCSPLASFTIKLTERKVDVGYDLINHLMATHRHSLRRLAFLDCGIPLDSLLMICKKCVQLERLDVPLPMKEIVGGPYC